MPMLGYSLGGRMEQVIFRGRTPLWITGVLMVGVVINITKYGGTMPSTILVLIVQEAEIVNNNDFKFSLQEYI